MKKNHLTIMRFIDYLSATMLILSVLTFFFTSCKEEAIIDKKDDNGGVSQVSGKDGNLNFLINFDSYGDDDEDVSTRSADDAKAETVVVPLGDGISMVATLEPVTKTNRKSAVSLRSFAIDARLCIVAYKKVSSVYNPEHHVGYRIVAGGGTLSAGLLRDDLHTPFTLNAGDSIRFVAYSYNDDTMPFPFILPATVDDIHPGRDLLWGESEDIEIVSGSNDILIKMKHKFSKVNMEALSNVGNINLLDVSMRGYTADLTVEYGTLTANTDSAMVFTGFTPLGTASVSSPSRIVYTDGSNPTVVDIDSVIIGITKYRDLTTTFAKQLQSGYEYNLRLNIGNTNVITDNNPPGMKMYVGAFWKANQTGERLIRIMPPASSNVADGTWSAVVVTGANWIVLDKESSTDPNIGWLGGSEASVHSYENSSFDSQHPVNSLQTAVSGVMDAGTPEIYFRIGLRSEYTPTPTDSARYGMILLTYGDNQYRQRIWIRQGEGADYLMKPQDLGGDGFSSWGSPNHRPEAARWSPYNLTYTGFGQVPPYSGEFTLYPTQAGAYFQWAHPTNINYAYPPTGSVTWTTGYEYGYWNPTLQTIHESCPDNYRRPNDGTITADNTTGYIAGSELRQSLWLFPQEDSNGNDMQNTVFGYYADGFFDRRLIDGQNAVSGANDAIAYIGNLFYNPNSKASLFFPAAGHRHSSSGAVTMPGVQGNYWTSSTYTAPDYAWTLAASGILAQPSYSVRGFGHNVRCVSFPCEAVSGVLLSSVPASTTTALTGESVYLTAVASPGGASNVKYTWQHYIGSSWETMSTTTIPSYTATLLDGINQFRVIAGNSCSTQNSSPVTITGYTPVGGSSARITWDDNDEKYVLTTDPRDAGLYFRFGSITGLFSGEGRHTQDLSVGTNSSQFVVADHVTINVATGVINGIGDIPFEGGATTLIDAAYHTATRVKAGLGDPCRLVGLDLNNIKNKLAGQLTQAEIDNGLWRLPTALEHQQFSGYAANTSSSPSNGPWWWSHGEDPTGFTLGVAGGEFPVKNIGGPGKFLPAAGDRDEEGKAIYQRIRGIFVTNTSYNATNYSGFMFTSNAVSIINTYYVKSWFRPVRCIPQAYIHCESLTGATIVSSGGNTVDVGTSTTLTASPVPVIATGPFTYQWAKWNGSAFVNILGATGSTYIVPTAGSEAIVAGSNEYRVSMTGQCGNTTTGTIIILGNVPGQDLDNVPPPNFMPYVGAFWKYNQTGERLIRMVRPTVGLSTTGTAGRVLSWMEETVADGAWRATVLEGSDWIELDDVPTSDVNVSWTSNLTPADMNNSGNDATYHIPPGTGVTTLTGVMNATNPQIYFRIGLKSTIASNAVRYGVVLLTYNNNTKVQRIFVRQGEAPDYLMRPNDALASGSDVSAGARNTTNTKKFSAYNLTATTLNTATTSGTRKFTDYPSQAGGLWQFTGTGAWAQYAWDASSISVPSGATFDNSNLWNPANETCPPGYRRVTDGSTSIITSINPSDYRVTTALMPYTEIRHSLYELVDRWYISGNPDVFATKGNALWGYYADGFFDRRQIVNAPNMVGGSGEAVSAVSVANANIAYAGLLFWNKYNNGSLFFPGTGYRDPTTFGALAAAGNNGCYATSSTPYGTSGAYHACVYMGFGSDQIQGRITLMIDGGRSLAIPIRCVEN